jgi:hypothetical protein
MLGAGSFATVHVATHKATGERFAGAASTSARQAVE